MRDCADCDNAIYKNGLIRCTAGLWVREGKELTFKVEEFIDNEIRRIAQICPSYTNKEE